MDCGTSLGCHLSIERNTIINLVTEDLPTPTIHQGRCPRMKREDYEIAIICALPVELAAVEAMLDERGDAIPEVSYLNTIFRYGKIGKHDVVLACLATPGLTSAAVVAEQVVSKFPNLRFGLMVGVGGGVPGGENDVRLGDVVVSYPQSTFGGVVQYDMGKFIQGTRECEFQRTGMLNRPPDILLTAVALLRAKHEREDSDVAKYVSAALGKFPKMRSRYTSPGPSGDRLFNADCLHQGGTTCTNCDPQREVIRPEREGLIPWIHYGTTASANALVRDAIVRDSLSDDHGALCVEMEAAGLMNHFPCIVVRGICDYADSHKNEQWQPCAALAAAAYAKEMLLVISPIQRKETSEMATAEQRQTPTQRIEGVGGNNRNDGSVQLNGSNVGGSFVMR